MRTSETHPLKIHGFPLGSGVVGMTLCPGRKGPSLYGPDWDRDLNADVGRLREWGATIIVSLTEVEEMERLGVGDLGATVRAAGMKWLHLPIADVGTPGLTWADQWRNTSPAIRQELADGGRVVIHCRAGLERTALVAALLQCDHGRDLDTAFSVIATARNGAGPLPNQRRWLETHITEGNQHSSVEQLDAFLLNHPAIATHTAEWADGTIRLRISTHLVKREQETAPTAFTTSGRCIVLANDSVLVMRNPDSRHILPGGRLEAGETSRDAVLRELREETGLTVTRLNTLAIMVYRHQTPRPAGYVYPYPVFTNDIFVTRLPVPVPITANDVYEQGGDFLRISDAIAIVAPHERELLRAALTTA